MAAASFTERQSQIVQQALRLIAEQGIEQVTYRNLAERLGITEPAFYRHFASKTEILKAILAYFEQVRGELFQGVRARGIGSLEAIESVFTEHLRLFQENHGLAALLFPEQLRQGRRELEAGVLQVMRSGQRQISEIVAEGIRRGEIRPELDPQQAATVISGSLRLLVTRWRLGRYAEDLRSQGARLWRTLAAMLGPTRIVNIAKPKRPRSEKKWAQN